MRICLYSPYVPKHYGGGEKYFFNVACELEKAGHQVFISLPSVDGQDFSSSELERIRRSYQDFFHISLDGISFIHSPIGSPQSWWRKLWWTKQFDVMYAVTDGSLFFSLAKKNILHIQVPYTTAQEGVVNRLKLLNWSVKNTNSLFTKSVIESRWRTKVGYVHYPAVDAPLVDDKKSEKRRVILSVGRFFRQLHSKQQHVLISIFISLVKNHPESLSVWKLVLVGGVEDREYVDQLHKLSEGYPIEFVHQADRSELISLYRESSLYWHAAGFGVDERVTPERVEHFGISTLEAMSYGCVPLVVGAGGQKEILQDFPELWWQTEDECAEKTLKWLKDFSSSEREVRELRQRLENRASEFGQERFKKTLIEMVGT